jgi:carboxymethylenebutenolidase
MVQVDLKGFEWLTEFSEVKMYLAEPKTGTKGGVLVLHAWWGLTPFIQSLCERLAGEGFLALAPDLYGGRTAQTISEAEKLRGLVPKKVATARVFEGWQALISHPTTKTLHCGVVGFSLGAFWALWLAEQKSLEVKAVTLFYGTRGGDYAQSQAAYMGHFAESDEFEPDSGVKKLEKALRTAGKQVDFYTYPGTGHWFFESDRPDAYQSEAAELAWVRTLKFLSSTLQSN